MQPDWFDIVSLVTNLVLAVLAIGLSVFFFWASARVERRVIEMLGKIETLSTAMHQVQSDLIRTAWARHVAPPANLPTEGEVEEPPPSAEEHVEAVEETLERRFIEYARSLQSLDAKALAALRLAMTHAGESKEIVRVTQDDPMQTELAKLGLDDSPWDTVMLEDFLDGLQSLVEHGVFRDIRESSTGTFLFIQPSREFIAHWLAHPVELSGYISYQLEATYLAEQFAGANPMD